MPTTPRASVQDTRQTTPDIRPNDLNFTAALIAAQNTGTRKRPGERDTEFVKRIVCAYLNAIPEANALLARINKASDHA